MTGSRKLRLFLDSNVLTGGIVSPWGLDKAVLSLCAAKICRLVLAEVELGSDEPRRTAPDFAIAEVTDDEEYSGGRLASASDADLLRIIPRKHEVGGIRGSR